MIINENGGFGSLLKRSRGMRGLSGVTCALSAILVDIIVVMRTNSPLLAVSEWSYLGEFKALGDSVKCGGKRCEEQETISGVENMILRMILN